MNRRKRRESGRRRYGQDAPGPTVAEPNCERVSSGERFFAVDSRPTPFQRVSGWIGFNAIGRPKTKSSARTFPVGPAVMETRKEWRLAYPKGKANLVVSQVL
jgi:hypothetical protein